MKKYKVSCPPLGTQATDVEADSPEEAEAKYRGSIKGLQGNATIKVVAPDAPVVAEEDAVVTTSNVDANEALRKSAEEAGRAARAANQENAELKARLAKLEADAAANADGKKADGDGKEPGSTESDNKDGDDKSLI